jgi:hypothetical protein
MAGVFRVRRGAMNMGSTTRPHWTKVRALSTSLTPTYKGDPMTKSMKISMTLLLLIAGGSQAFAASGPSMQEKMACRSDAQTFCSQFVGKPQQMLACLHDNKTKISPACRQVVDAHGG